ncbi:MAG: WecB/TagA/CpsF family glycosyltransferase [Anaerolineae bacterium]|nr:WecB/TagA/CpsF family glycosyltransferase [Anaerolineae bacterium]
MPQRILLVQLGDIGDLILTTPAIAALRNALPDAHLALLTASHAAAVLEPGAVDEVVSFDKRIFNSSYALLFPSNFAEIWKLRRGNYDTVIFFHHFTLKLGTLKFWLIAKASGAERILGLDNGNGWFLTDCIPDEGFGAKHQAQYWLELVGLLGADSEPQRAQVGFDDGVLPLPVNMGLRVVIHAGSGGYSLARRWEPENFAAVADDLIENRGAEIVLVGTPGDNADEVESLMQHPAQNLSGKTSLTQLADVIRSADLYIGADSGVMHLAAAVRTPMIAIFGPSTHEASGPWTPNGKVVVLRSAPECSPCSYVGHGVGLREGCPARTCMRMVTPAEVLQTAEAMLAQGRVPRPSYPRHQRDWQDRIQILGLPVDRITYEDWLGLVGQWVQRRDRVYHVCTTNPEFMVIAQKDVNFANILRRADLCLPDGVGLMLAAQVLKTPLIERVTGSDGILALSEAAAANGWSLFLLGAAEGVADEAAGILQETFPGLRIAGTYAGSPAPEEEDAIVAMVNAAQPDLLLVAYGAPQQDKWIARNSPRLNVAMAMGVGGSLDFVAGRVPRAPEWMRRYGLEWLYRLYKQPWRIRRMLRLPWFVLLVLIRREK